MTVSLSELEMSAVQRFIHHCILPERQQRFLTLMQSKKGLLKWLDSLDHFQRYLDASRASDLSKKPSGDSIVKDCALPAACQVFVLSTFNDMRGVTLRLDDAITQTFQMGNGSIICPLTDCKFHGLYFGEERFAQYLWLNSPIASRTH
jgi:hypothetical protein